jgi:glycosyltransferase involved in cell wall biosynthesis
MLSVILCTYNRAESLRRTLSTLLEQDGLDASNVWELLIVDNNSKDHTREVAEEFVRQAAFPVRYVFEGRQGKSHALNTAIESGKGDLLAFTDDDVLVDKRWVASIIEAGRSYPHLFFGGKVVPLWEHPIPPWINPKSPYSRQIIGGAIVSHDRGEEIREYGPGMWVPAGANMFIRREAFAKFGGFRTDLGPNGGNLDKEEDAELGFRLQKSGVRLLYYPKAVVHHPVTPDRLTRKYLLKYFWTTGHTEGRTRWGQLTMERRFKELVKLIPEAATGTLQYLANLGKDDEIRLYHKVQLYRTAGRVHYYMTES